MPRNLLFLDFETYYDDIYSLRKITPAEYILDRRFETILVAVKANTGPHEVVDGPDLPQWLQQFDPDDTVTVTFNSLFDNAILAWKYGFIPSRMIDAMGMARALDGHKFKRFSLDHIAQQLGFPSKGDTVKNVKGMRRQHFSAEFFKEYGDYSLRDNLLCEMIFTHYYPKMPKSELRVMDMTLRACIEPRFVGDNALLEGHIVDLMEKEEALMVAANNVDRKLLLSTNKFKQALIDAGFPEEDIETKTSPTGATVPAFAKNDHFMEYLQNHPDPHIAALATARIGARSRLEETRGRTLLRIGKLPWHDAASNPIGSMPIPLRYGAAHTHRLGGDWKMNMQNLPRGSKLRHALRAPKDHTVLTIDLGQIEARLVAWICGCGTLLQEFAKYDAGDKTYDPYNRLGSAIFGTSVNRKSADPVQAAMGFIGKTGILGLGYGCGRNKFHIMVMQGARAFRIDLDAIGYSEELAHSAVGVYRERYNEIRDGWYQLDRIMQRQLFSAHYGATTFGPMRIAKHLAMLPNGMPLHYMDVQYEDLEEKQEDGTIKVRRAYKYWHAGTPYRIYGAKLLENFCQALGRIIVMDAALRIKAKTGYNFAHQAHDELIYILPTSDLDGLKQIIHKEMTTPPTWGLDLPLVADIGTGKTYGEAK